MIRVGRKKRIYYKKKLLNLMSYDDKIVHETLFKNDRNGCENSKEMNQANAMLGLCKQTGFNVTEHSK